jgi:hypothetical protein
MRLLGGVFTGSHVICAPNVYARMRAAVTEAFLAHKSVLILDGSTPSR